MEARNLNNDLLKLNPLPARFGHLNPSDILEKPPPSQYQANTQVLPPAITEPIAESISMPGSFSEPIQNLAQAVQTAPPVPSSPIQIPTSNHPLKARMSSDTTNDFDEMEDMSTTEILPTSSNHQRPSDRKALQMISHSSNLLTLDDLAKAAEDNHLENHEAKQSDNDTLPRKVTFKMTQGQPPSSVCIQIENDSNGILCQKEKNEDNRIESSPTYNNNNFDNTKTPEISPKQELLAMDSIRGKRFNYNFYIIVWMLEELIWTISQKTKLKIMLEQALQSLQHLDLIKRKTQPKLTITGA